MSTFCIAIGSLQLAFLGHWMKLKFGSNNLDEILSRMTPEDIYYTITQGRSGMLMWMLGSILSAMGK